MSICRVGVFFLCLRLFLFAPVAVRANGLVYRLPKDGSWVTYHMTQTSVRNGIAGTETTGSLTIRSVGAVVEEGKACR